MARFTLKRAAKYGSLKRDFRPCGRFAGLMMSRLSKQRKEAMVKRIMQVIRKRFLPNTRDSQPVMGSTTALLTR